MQRLLGWTVIFGIGAAGYSLLEILWRGYTHWSMALAGGGCFAALYRIDRQLTRAAAWLKAAAGCALITAVEFAVGCVVNLWLRWNVWDYSERFGNLFGQICPLFSLIWFAVSLAVFPVCAVLRRLLEHPREPRIGGAEIPALPQSRG